MYCVKIQFTTSHLPVRNANHLRGTGQFNTYICIVRLLFRKLKIKYSIYYFCNLMLMLFLCSILCNIIIIKKLAKCDSDWHEDCVQTCMVFLLVNDVHEERGSKLKMWKCWYVTKNLCFCRYFINCILTQLYSF